LAGGVDRDVSAVDQLDRADRGPTIGDAVLLGVRSAARRNAVSKRISFPGLGIIMMSRPNAVSVPHESLATPGTGRLVFGVVILADADPALGQLRDLDLTGGDDASAGRFAEPVEGAPGLEGKNPLGPSAGLPNRRVFEGHMETLK
jgi:hypothetical protein